VTYIIIGELLENRSDKVDRCPHVNLGCMCPVW